MVYCGKCGHQNNDDALFCGGCGAPLKKADDNRPDPPRWERIHLQRVGASEKEEGTTPRREKGASIWAEMAAKKKKAEEQPEKKQPEKKKGGGCLRHLLGWAIGLAVFFVLWVALVKACSDEEGGREKDDQDPTKFERIMSQASADSLQAAIGFPQTTDDVAPLAGYYEVMAQGYEVTVSLEPVPNGKVVGKAEMKLNGRSKVKGVYAYCGNSIYGIYENEENVGGKARNYFYAQPDRKSIMMIDGGEYILKRKEEKPVAKKGNGTNTLLSGDYEKCKSEASMASIIKEQGFPETYNDQDLEFGTYSYKAEVKGETHSVSYQLKPYEGENKMIVATLSVLSDGKEVMSGFVGYCGFSIYAAFMKEVDKEKPYEDDRIRLDSPYTNDYIYANSDGSMGLYFDGSEKIRMKLGEVETVKFD